MLEVKNLNSWWGAAQALFDVSLHVGEGELVVLQGLNGAGKSSLLASIMGIEIRAEGEISYQKNSELCNILRGHRHMSSFLVAQQGIGYVPEDRRLFTELSVRDNLRIAVSSRLKSSVIEERESRALDLFPPLKTMLGRPALQMSGGEQQMLAIARTLMTAPKLLLLDEPCEGIAPVLVEQMAVALLELQKQGMTLLIAEQNQVLARHANRNVNLVAGSINTHEVKNPHQF